MGEDGLQARIDQQGTTDYYSLHLPLETQRFVLRIVAVKLILSNPEAFGFHLAEEDYYPPLTFDQIEVHLSEKTPIRIVAEAAGTHFKAIKDLNPEFRKHYLPSGTHDILIPKGSAEGFYGRFKGLTEGFVADKKTEVYVVRPGDNLSIIADKFEIPLNSLIMCNDIDPKRPIHAGMELIICSGQ
jgi:hypothetical protein